MDSETVLLQGPGPAEGPPVSVAAGDPGWAGFEHGPYLDRSGLRKKISTCTSGGGPHQRLTNRCMAFLSVSEEGFLRRVFLHAFLWGSRMTLITAHTRALSPCQAGC